MVMKIILIKCFGAKVYIWGECIKFGIAINETGGYLKHYS